MTETGQRVRELRVQGMTHQQISDELRVSRKTVKYWLSDNYRARRSEEAKRRSARRYHEKRDELEERRRLRAARAENTSLLYRATNLFMRAKSRALVKDVAFDLTEAWIADALICGTCARTGIAFEPSGPWAASLDRVDSSRGYVAGNVQAVCWAYNRAKGASTDAVVLRLAVALVQKTIVNNGTTFDELVASVVPVEWD